MNQHSFDEELPIGSTGRRQDCDGHDASDPDRLLAVQARAGGYRIVTRVACSGSTNVDVLW
jgi:hypothetical protein